MSITLFENRVPSYDRWAGNNSTRYGSVALPCTRTAPLNHCLVSIEISKECIEVTSIIDNNDDELSTLLAQKFDTWRNAGSSYHRVTCDSLGLAIRTADAILETVDTYFSAVVALDKASYERSLAG